MHSLLKFAIAKTLSLHPAICLLFLLALPFAASSQTHTVNATIDTSKTGAPISKNIYGQFLEHGGDIVNTGIWSEMLVDRKFFYPVATSAPTPPPVLGNAAGNPRMRRVPTRWWAPIGGDDVVTQQRSERAGQHVGIFVLTMVPVQRRRQRPRRHRMVNHGEAPVRLETINLPVDAESAQLEMVAGSRLLPLLLRRRKLPKRLALYSASRVTTAASKATRTPASP